MLFDFVNMAASYDARKVGRFDDGDVMVSTCSVTDSRFAFETAVAHPDYNGGEMIIVENYDSRKEAAAGHEKWVRVITTEPLPDELHDVGGGWIADLCDAVAEESWRVFKRGGSRK